MRRRHLLGLFAAGASGLAGCSVFDDDETLDQVTPASVPTATRTPFRTIQPGRTVDSQRSDVVRSAALDRTYAAMVDGVRPRASLDIDRSVRFAAAATARHPTRLAGSLHNRSDTELRVNLSTDPLFAAVPQTAPVDGEQADALVLVPTRNHEKGLRSPPIERAENGRWRLGQPPEGALVDDAAVTLAPGDTLGYEYWLVGRHDGTGFPTGRYVFGETEHLTVSTWVTSRPGPAASSTFVEPDPPPLTRLGEVEWFHEAGPGSETYLVPGAEQVELPESVSYRLVNRGMAVAGTRWLLLKRAGGRWFDVTPPDRPRYRGLLRLGDRETWTLALSHGASTDGVGWLGGGRYAFVVDVGYSDAVYAALLSVDAPERTVVPEADLSVEREALRVTVTHHSWSESLVERPGTVILRRYNGEPDRRLLPEQVMRRPALRNTLPFAGPDVERITLQIAETQLSGLVSEEPFSFAGERFDVDLA